MTRAAFVALEMMDFGESDGGAAGTCWSWGRDGRSHQEEEAYRYEHCRELGVVGYVCGGGKVWCHKPLLVPPHFLPCVPLCGNRVLLQRGDIWNAVFCTCFGLYRIVLFMQGNSSVSPMK